MYPEHLQQTRAQQEGAHESSAMPSPDQPRASLQSRKPVSSRMNHGHGWRGACCCTAAAWTCRRCPTVCSCTVWSGAILTVVVTSPIGVHAPPALAAITTTAPSSLRNSGSSGTALCTATNVDQKVSAGVLHVKPLELCVLCRMQDAGPVMHDATKYAKIARAVWVS